MQHPLVIQIEEVEWVKLIQLAKEAGVSIEKYVTDLISSQVNN